MRRLVKSNVVFFSVQSALPVCILYMERHSYMIVHVKVLARGPQTNYPLPHHI